MFRVSWRNRGIPVSLSHETDERCRIRAWNWTDWGEIPAINSEYQPTNIGNIPRTTWGAYLTYQRSWPRSQLSWVKREIARTICFCEGQHFEFCEIPSFDGLVTLQVRNGATRGVWFCVRIGYHKNHMVSLFSMKIAKLGWLKTSKTPVKIPPAMDSRRPSFHGIIQSDPLRTRAWALSSWSLAVQCPKRRLVGVWLRGIFHWKYRGDCMTLHIYTYIHTYIYIHNS